MDNLKNKSFKWNSWKITFKENNKYQIVRELVRGTMTVNERIYSSFGHRQIAVIVDDTPYILTFSDDYKSVSFKIQN